MPVAMEFIASFETWLLKEEMRDLWTKRDAMWSTGPEPSSVTTITSPRKTLNIRARISTEERPVTVWGQPFLISIKKKELKSTKTAKKSTKKMRLLNDSFRCHPGCLNHCLDPMYNFLMIAVNMRQAVLPQRYSQLNNIYNNASINASVNWKLKWRFNWCFHWLQKYYMYIN